MSEFSTRMAATALGLLTKRGVDVTLERNPSGDMNAAGDRTTAPSESPTKGVFIPTGGTALIDGREVSVAQVLLAAVTPSPAAGNHVVITDGPNAGHYLIHRARNWAPEGSLIYSDLEVVL